MKKICGLLTIILLFIKAVHAQSPVAYLDKSSFNEGETLKYKLKYGFVTAAEATLQVLPTDLKLSNNEVYHLVAQGRTSGTFDIFYKIRNRYDSYIDKDTYQPYLYTENIRENSYRRTDKARFYQQEKKVVANKGTFKSPVSQTFDLVSAYYFARNLDLSHIAVGDKISLYYFLSDEITPLSITYLGKEVIRTSQGKLRCLKFSPSISPGRVFRKDSQLFLWVSDDANHIPVKAQADVIVGSITMEIASVQGLKQPLQIVK